MKLRIVPLGFRFEIVNDEGVILEEGVQETRESAWSIGRVRQDANWHKANVEARNARVAELSKEPKQLLMRSAHKRWVYLISSCLLETGKWRMTRFSGDRVVDHVTRASYADALFAAVDYGADISTAVLVTASNVDATLKAAS